MENVNEIKVNLHKKRDYGYSIPVCMNEKNLEFLVDTGCQKSIVFSSATNQLELCDSKVEYIVKDSCGKRSRVKSAIIADIGIAEARLEQIEFLLMENKMFLGWRKLSGILGMDILGKLNFTINFPKKCFSINGLNGFSKNDNNVEYIDIFANEVKTTAMFDTGANCTWISEGSAFSGFTYKNRYILRKSIKRIEIKKQKEYQNLLLKGACFPCYKSCIAEGRKVFRNEIRIGVVIGLDYLADKELMYQNGNWKVQCSL